MMYETILITLQGAVSVVCWLIVAGGATLAVFTRAINDTVLERIGLSAVAIASVGTAWRIVGQGWITDGGASLSIAVAGYVAAVAWKHIRRQP